jgi:CheY-like chemotaxis protein
VYFEVKDSGIGMTPQQIGKIFEPFIQADDSITRKYGGTGLGLTITRNFIEMMGGRLNVESTAGVGSKFGFELTFEIVSDASEIPVEKISFNNVERPVFKGEILVCEDNIMNQKVISDHLEKVGIKAVIAENGKEGVDFAVKRQKQGGEAPFDLIFMDIHMPVMDGLEAASRIASHGINTPIIALTANIMPNDIELYNTNGIIDFIGKPFLTQELWQCLLKYLTPLSFVAVEEHHEAEDNEKLLKYLKVNFVKDNKNKYEEIIKAASDGDIKLAHRLSHTLKTNAGQIGEKELQEAAFAVEKIFLDSSETFNNEQLEDNVFGVLQAELKLVLGKLEQENIRAEKDNEKTNIKESADIAKTLELFEKLENMINSRNPESISLLDDIRAIPGSGELAHLVEEYEFKQALIELNKLKSAIM